MNKRFLLLFSALLLFLIYGCATRPVFTQEEWTTITTRTFKDKTTSDVLNAAEKVLLLADKSDVRIFKWPTRLLGTRHVFVYFIIGFYDGVYSFDLNLSQAGPDVNATLLITVSAGGANAMPVGATSSIVSGSSVGGNIVDFQELYALFFSRINSLLYDKTWLSCTKAKALHPNSRIGAFEGLCLMADDIPPSVIVK